MRRDEEIEAVGMRVSMQYERDHGFDVRYIEVKARARSGAVRISANEWKKARHFGEKFWLYGVTEAGMEIHRIQHPVVRFRERRYLRHWFHRL